MRIRTVTLALAAAAIMLLGLAGTGLAFHDGGVASCSSCHSMHNSLGGAANVTGKAQFTAGPMLMKGTDQSSVCLNCHGDSATRASHNSYTALVSFVDNVSAPQQHTPAGDFAWLKIGTNTARDLRGHNIIAVDFGLAADGRAGMGTSPGGSYPNSQFYCSSCHDPHGKYRILVDGSVSKTGGAIGSSGSYGNVPTTTDNLVGTYRFLAGKGYLPKSIALTYPAAAFDSATDPPVAIAPSSYNATIGDVPVAYGSGMSEWCKNCHASIHNNNVGLTVTRHPSGNTAKLNAAIIANYNTYVKTGDMSGTGGSAAYNPLVPFEHGTADRAVLMGYVTAPAAPDASSNVMCLSCHRAHATGFQSMLRWNNTMMVSGGVYATPTGLAAGAQTLAAYYDQPATPTFATYQRSLCNKCHAQD